jgi:hypothetical protein
LVQAGGRARRDRRILMIHACPERPSQPSWKLDEIDGTVPRRGREMIALSGIAGL